MSETAEIIDPVAERAVFVANRMAEQSISGSFVGIGEKDGEVFYGIDFKRRVSANEELAQIGTLYFNEGGILVGTAVACGITPWRVNKFKSRVARPVRELVRDVYCQGSDIFDPRLDWLLSPEP